MIGGLVAVLMIVAWIGYIAGTVMAITNGDATQLAAWAIVTPFVFGFEWLGIQILERTAKFG